MKIKIDWDFYNNYQSVSKFILKCIIIFIFLNCDILFSQTKKIILKTSIGKKLSSQEILNNLYNEIDSLGYKKEEIKEELSGAMIDISQSTNLIDSINHIINLTWNSQYNQPKIGVFFINKIISLHENETNPERRSTFEFYLGKALSVKAHCHLELWEYDSTYFNFSKSLFYRKRTGDPLETIWGYNNISQYFNKVNEIDSAAYYLSKSIDVLRKNTRDFHFHYNNVRIFSKVNIVNVNGPLLYMSYYEILSNYYILGINSTTLNFMNILNKQDEYYQIRKEISYDNSEKYDDERILRIYKLILNLEDINKETIKYLEKLNEDNYKKTNWWQFRNDIITLYTFIIKLAYYKNKITYKDWEKLNIDSTSNYNPLELALFEFINLKFSKYDLNTRRKKLKDIVDPLLIKLNLKEKKYVRSILLTIFNKEIENYEYYIKLSIKINEEEAILNLKAKNSKIIQNSISNLNSFHQFIMSRVETYNVERFTILIGIIIVIALILLLAIILLFKNRQLTKSAVILNKQLSERNFINQKMYSVISHDLSAPISYFEYYLNEITKNFQNNNQLKALEQIESLKNKSNFINDTLESMLDYLKFEDTKIELIYESTNLNEIVFEVKNLNINYLNDKNIEIQTKGIENEIYTEKTFISIIIRNLLQNSIKFSKPNSIIIVELSNIENQTIIKIIDFGIGITPKRREAILNGIPITAGVDTNNKQSSAFGFLLVRDLVIKLGGNINIEDNSPSGTIVIITLPNKSKVNIKS